MAKKQTLVESFTPECGVTGVLMLFGCAATVGFTAYYEWDPWAFGGVFALIMTGGKALKIADSKFGGRK